MEYWERRTPQTTRDQSQRSSYYVQTQSRIMPPPVGLQIVSMPNPKLFNLYLDGTIDIEQVLSASQRKVTSPQNPQTYEPSTSASVRKKNQSMFGLVEQMQRQKKQMSIIQKRKLGYVKRKETLVSLTSSTREIFQQQVEEESRKFQPSARRGSMFSSIYSFQNKQDENFIKRCEVLAGEKLTQEEINLLLKRNINDNEMWDILNRFSKKKWFFEYILRNVNTPSQTPQNLPNKLFSKLKNVVQKQPLRKMDHQCQEYLNHIKNIEDCLRQQILKRELPERIRKSQLKSSVRKLRSESQIDDIQFKQASLFDPLKSNRSEQPSPMKQKKKYEHHAKQAQVSREDDMSFASQNDTYKSFTEFKLNELYLESKLRQKQYQKEFSNDKPIENANQLQRKVKQIVKLGNIQKNILYLSNTKLKI